jgi:hypothetical protein
MNTCGDGASTVDECRNADKDDAAKGTNATLDMQQRTVPTPTETLSVAEPRNLLTVWHAIVDVLRMKYSQRKDVKSLNARFNGPINNNGAGTRPMVYRDVLLRWWNSLAVLQQDLANQREGSRLATEAHYNYGRDGTVAPEIGGGIKKRRGDKKPNKT